MEIIYRILNIFDRLIKWYTRPKSKIYIAGKFLVITGLSLIGVTTALKFAIKTPEGLEVTASFIGNDTGIFIFSISAIFVVVGFVFILLDAIRDINNNKKANIILVEHTALFKTLSSSFLSTVTKAQGKVRSVKIDISEHYKEGVLNNPEEAVNDTRVILKKALQSLADATGNEDASIHYGGTPPVCLGLYSGFLVGNTTNVTLWDYDRDLSEWHPLDRSYDSNHPQINTTEYDKTNKKVCLVFNISFDIEIQARSMLPADSIVTIRMPQISHDNMSSLSKLKKFKREFRDLLNQFTQDGIQEMHIFCAAQSSFNFAIGQQITKNHPSCFVYEYVNSKNKPYPWALKFNDKSSSLPMVV